MPLERPHVSKGTFHMLTLRQCQTLLKPLKKLPDGANFLVPVDPVRLGIPDYFHHVKHPMDLGTIEKKLASADGNYCADNFVEDVRLVWYNALIYNPQGTPVALAASRMSAAFEEMLKNLVASGSGAAAAGGGGRTVSDIGGVMPTKNAKAIVRSLQQNQHSLHFRIPVDPIKQGIPNYPDIIKRPMDLSTVAKKLDAGQYPTVGDLRDDLDLIWDNAVTFNTEASLIGDQAVKLRGFTATKFAQEGFPTSAPILPPGPAIVRNPSAVKEAAPAAPAPPRDTSRKRSLAGDGNAPLSADLVAAAQRAAAAADAARADMLSSSEVMLPMKRCRALLEPLKQEKIAGFFLQPVDPVALKLPDYLVIVKRPMDLGTIEGKLQEGSYTSPGDFVDEVRLVWSNARLYNAAATVVHQAALELAGIFERQLWSAVKPSIPMPASLQAIGGSQEFHAHYLGIKINRSLEIANAQHGVEDSHSGYFA